MQKVDDFFELTGKKMKLIAWASTISSFVSSSNDKNVFPFTFLSERS